MKCEECLPRLEEYVDGELDGRTSARVETHLSACASCASEFAELRRDEEIYAHYRRDVEVTSAHWNIVRARIEQEKDKHAPETTTRRREWFGRVFGSKGKFRPAFVAALLLIAIGMTALVYLTSRNRQTNLASGPPKPGETLPIGGSPETLTAKSSEDEQPIVEDVRREKNNSGQQTRTVARNRTGRAGRRETAVVARAPRAENRRHEQPTPDNMARFEMAAADNVITGVRRSALMTTGNFDLDVAHHAEKAELLLRSFRNVRLPANARTLDVTYEKEQSRKLLYRNIALRRDAAARGDESTAEVLNKLEPILLDIANLPNRARSRDVRSIEQRMEKKEIVATLQVRTLVAAN
jgi:Putative zinc-finger